MLSVVENLEPLTVPEQKLLAAVRSGGQCAFFGDSEADRAGGDKTDWGDDRRVRAAVLKEMLSGDGEAWGIDAGAAVDLSGAVVSGDLTGFVGSQLPPIQLRSCRFDDGVDFTGATFTGPAVFSGVTFTGPAVFSGVTFTGEAGFDGATFTGDARFDRATFTGEARFHRATFTGPAVFYRATFTSEAWAAWFDGATFTGEAWFNGATFTGQALFSGATFTGEARFSPARADGAEPFTGATFSGAAVFSGATFTGDAGFDGATFTGPAVFSGVTFTGDAGFDGATFTGTADFERALAHRLSFPGAVFSAPDPGPWTASTVSLDRAVLAVRSRISITAMEIDASWLQAREGAHLVLHCKRVDLSDSEFLRRSIVSSPAAAEEIPARTTPEAPSGDSPREDARAAAAAAAKKLRDDLESEFAGLAPRCRMTSLTRANIGELVLSDVVLDDCAFVGAHGLDKLRIGPGCSFQPTPRRLGWRLLGSRRIIAEELRWRQAHTGRAKTGHADFLPAPEIAEIYRDPRKGLDDAKDEPGPFYYGEMERRLPTGGAKTGQADFLPAPEIAEIYRNLRKGLEEAKNEPDAADFYYGEMEMRRLAGRKPTGIAASRRSAPSWADRTLLNGYWAVSGYGLRASRALITLVVVVIGSALLYTSPAFSTETPPPAQIAMIDPKTGVVTNTNPPPAAAPRFSKALEYSVRESISLLQVRSTPTLDTTAAGTLLDFFLRLAGPVLLAFTVLALRARIKR